MQRRTEEARTRTQDKRITEGRMNKGRIDKRRVKDGRIGKGYRRSLRNIGSLGEVKRETNKKLKEGSGEGVNECLTRRGREGVR